jgi:hypothetical protein
MTQKEAKKIFKNEYPFLSLIDILDGLDGAGLVITDHDLIKKALKGMGLKMESVVPF